MIAINSKIIETIYQGKRPIQEIRKGAQLVWEAIKDALVVVSGRMKRAG